MDGDGNPRAGTDEAKTGVTTPPRLTEPQGDEPSTQVSWPSSTGTTAWESGGSSLARYKLDALIGRGGMGEVVSAHDEQLGRSVAIKRLRDTSEEAVARFVREARIQGRLDHPAIAPVHELWRDEHGQPFFVMKQLAGVTLYDVLARLAKRDADAIKDFSRQRLLRAFVDVCLAIEFAHTRGVVHRDLKPGNLMLGDFGEAYILDWGVARVVDEAPLRASQMPLKGDGGTVAGSILGTPGYMSPEQIKNDPDLDGRADVYALGCILFEILSGEPLHGRGETGITSALLGVDGKPSARAPERVIPPELDAVCVRATMIDRGDRFESARALADTVQRYLDGDRDEATRTSLARSELDAARDAMERGTTPSDRRTAIRAAARSLALDPTSHDAAQLVGRLMIEPPKDTPPEVERELDVLDDDAMRAQARLSWFAMTMYLAFFPVMFAAGFRDAWYLIAGPALVVAVMIAGRMLEKRPAMSFVWVTFVGNAILIAMLSRLLTPLLVAPGIAVLSVMAYAMHPRAGRAWVLWLGLALAVLLPLAAEVTGLVSRTTQFAGDAIILHTSADPIHPTITLVGLVVYVLAILALAAFFSRSLATKRVDDQRALHIQAWQLRQLVPRAGTGKEMVA